METWYERWNIKVNENKTEAIYFSPTLRPAEACFMLNARKAPFVNQAKYDYVIFDKRIT
jgi:hypothetical protein